MNSDALAHFDINPTHGFLPLHEPLRRLPPRFDAWEELAIDLPKVLMTDGIRSAIEALPEFPISYLSDDREWRRAMVVLSYLGHAYVWSGPRPAEVLPRILAVPWHAVATHLGRPPVLSYASYCIDNWRRYDMSGLPVIGNIALNQNFLAGMDEEWFILIHVDIEFQSAKGIAVLVDAQQAAMSGDAIGAARHLNTIADAVDAMNVTMDRMPESCDPYIYYHRVRPYIHGWKNHPDLPEGLIYEGVDEYGGRPQQFRGETGAQSSIVPCLDAALGIYHEEDILKTYLMEMRDYIPPRHRAFIADLESRPSVREFVMSCSDDSVRAAYDRCVKGLERFRTTHLEFAATYIFKQAQTDPKNPHAVGTGGTPFMKYLKKHRDETEQHALSS